MCGVSRIPNRAALRSRLLKSWLRRENCSLGSLARLRNPRDQKMNQPANNLFTASQIARALGVKRQAAQRLLSSIAPSGQVIANGRPASAWMISALPAPSQAMLASRAQGSGFRDTEQLLSAPARLWQPPIPLVEVAPDC